jgi:hypothetical protein
MPPDHTGNQKEKEKRRPTLVTTEGNLREQKVDQIPETSSHGLLNLRILAVRRFCASRSMAISGCRQRDSNAGRLTFSEDSSGARLVGT